MPADPSYKYDSHTRLQLEGKDQMRARGVPSPDEWDAVRSDLCRAGERNPEQLQPRDRVPAIQRSLELAPRLIRRRPTELSVSRSVRPRTFAAGLNSSAAFSLGVLFSKDIEHSDVVLACFPISSGE